MRNNKDILLRINEIMDYYKLNKTQFSNKIGIHQSNFSKILNEERNIGDGTINKILLSFDINKEWLLKGEGEMLKTYKDDKKLIPMIEMNEPLTTQFLAQAIRDLAEARKIDALANKERAESDKIERQNMSEMINILKNEKRLTTRTDEDKKEGNVPANQSEGYIADKNQNVG